jgi:hypothetical protein
VTSCATTSTSTGSSVSSADNLNTLGPRSHSHPISRILATQPLRQLACAAERLPAQPNPLLNVVGEGSPHRFCSDLRNSADMEPPRPKLFVDPGVHKLGNLRPLPQRSFSLSTCGLSTKSRNHRPATRGMGDPLWLRKNIRNNSSRAESTFCNLSRLPGTAPSFGRVALPHGEP